MKVCHGGKGKQTCIITLDNKIVFIFCHTTKAGKLNSIFCIEFKYVVSFFCHTRILSDVRLKFEENLYLHYITESIYITQVLTVDDFLLYFACVTSYKCKAIISQHTGTHLPWYRFSMVEMSW